MRALWFENQAALEVALRSGLIPPDVQRAAAQVGVGADGAIEIAPETALSASAEQRLQQAGVTFRTAQEPSRAVSCWAEAIAPHHLAGDFELPSTLLFTVPAEQALVTFSAELIRLGCNRQELASVTLAEIRALAKVKDPPFFAVSRALEHEDGVRAFAPVAGSQERVWLEVGYAHRALDVLKAPPDGLLIVTGDGRWRSLEEPSWFDVDGLLDIDGLPAVEHEAARSLPRIPIKVRLARGAATAAPTFFVVDEGQAAIEALVASSPEPLLDSILFAVTDAHVLLRVRPGRGQGLEVLPGRPFVSVQELANLFMPQHMAIEPPLRRERLRQWLTPEVDSVTWLEPTPTGFSKHTVSDDAFRPLSEWVDYIIDGAAPVLKTWAQSAQFNFDTILGVESLPVASDARPSNRGDGGEAERSAAPAGARQGMAEADPSAPRVAPRTSAPDPVRPVAPAPSAPTGLVIESQRTPAALDAEILREETAFLELDDAHEAVTRQRGWARLAQLYSGVQRWREANLAWAQAAWAADAATLPELVNRWASGVGSGGSLLETPARNQVDALRAAVPQLMKAALQKDALPAEAVARWHQALDSGDVDLDVRSAWLARVALAQLSGTDALALARARDRLLLRLQRGLSIDRDIPRLVTAASRQGPVVSTSDRTHRVVEQLEALLKAFADTPRKRTAMEAPPQLTQAYVGFEFAWGLARLGQGDRARALVQQGIEVVGTRNRVHAYLTRAYSERVTQAIEGVSPETPLPHELTATLSALPSFERYAVDRLRSYSVILEPQERLDPFTGWIHAKNNRGEELAALRGLTDASQMLSAIEERIAAATKSILSAEERVRLLDGLCDLVPRLPEAAAVPLLQRLVALADDVPPRLRAMVIEDALRVAGHFGKTALVKQLVGNMAAVLTEVGADGVREVSGTLLEGLRSLRRVGLRDEAAELLRRAASLLRGDDAEVLQARLALAGGFAYLGDTVQAGPIVEQAQRFLSQESSVGMSARLKLTLAAARALGNGSTEVALPQLLRLAQQLPWITDMFNMKEYCCISVVSFADALVLGHVGEDLTLKESTRRFLEEDEHAVRRRIHRDVSAPRVG